MIKEHINAIHKLEKDLANLKTLADQLPEGTPKGKLLGHCEAMEITLEHYRNQSGDMYDKLVTYTRS